MLNWIAVTSDSIELTSNFIELTSDWTLSMLESIELTSESMDFMCRLRELICIFMLNSRKVLAAKKRTIIKKFQFDRKN